MSAVTVIADDLRAKVARALSEMAVAHPRSVAGNIRGEHFDTVVEEVAKTLDLYCPDFECALIVAASRVKEASPNLFYRRRSRADAFSNFWK